MPSLADGSPVVMRPRSLPDRVPNVLYLEAIRAFLRGAKLPEVRELLNVPLPTVWDVVESEEWHRTCDIYRKELNFAETAFMTRAIGKALQVCIERLEQGDPVVSRKGVITYAPVKAKDAAAIAAVLMERREKVQRKLDGVPDNDPLEDLERLATIAGKLRELKQPAEKDITPGFLQEQGLRMIDVDIDADEHRD